MKNFNDILATFSNINNIKEIKLFNAINSPKNFETFLTSIIEVDYKQFYLIFN